MANPKKILIEVSNRHAHLSKEHLNALFGENYNLTINKSLSQPNQYSTNEKITLIHQDRKIENVRVLGPPRESSQVEISRTDAFHLKIPAPLKLSGDLEESPGIILKGPIGEIKLEKGVIISHRHLHASEDEARELGIQHNQTVVLKVPGLKETIFCKVLVRVHPEHRLSFHIDCDDGNACFFQDGVYAEIIELN
ncbi:phosphate propanoyltransferase [archaeon]|jgi:propanediol utilization protein|nr:phosphate propanoyltransferase [archaeon]